jgi:hypothetical protein
MEDKESTFEYRLNGVGLFGLSFTSAVLENMQTLQSSLPQIPEPFNVINHAGNMWIGASVVLLAGWLYGAWKTPEKSTAVQISETDYEAYQKYIMPLTFIGTIAVNCMTETQWGIDNLPFAKFFHGITPDILDTIYSVGYAAISSKILWNKVDKA